MKQSVVKPKEGFLGLKENWQQDMSAGFMVFLLALPLSLGIAKASGFPASMGVLTAIIGGLLTSFFKVAPLTIKGPAAGLITISATAMLEFGSDEAAWHTVTATIMVAAVIQVVISWLKLGKLTDFFPHAAVHGMLAAIGIIIIAKQIPVLLGDDPKIYAGESPIELLLDIPNFISHAHWHIAVVGIIGLVVMFGLPMLGFTWVKKIPAPMVVLLLAVPLSLYWHFADTEPNYSLVEIGDFWGTLGLNFSFAKIGTFTFWKYVLMFLFVNSLESLLTVKAIDGLDPYKRTTNPNGDLLAVGAGNFVAGFLGATPMISEVVRSSANVNFGGRTKWANFFHAIFLLLAMLLLIPFIELIPNAALAAMLIYAGYRLAAPREFIQTYRVGKEQFLIFFVTIAVTLLEDLLLGIAAGIAVKMLLLLYNGASLRSLFKAVYEVKETEDWITFEVATAATFCNLIRFKEAFYDLPKGRNLRIDFSRAPIIDHSFMEFLHHFQHNYEDEGGRIEIVGTDGHKPFSEHPLAGRKLVL